MQTQFQPYEVAAPISRPVLPRPVLSRPVLPRPVTVLPLLPGAARDDDDALQAGDVTVLRGLADPTAVSTTTRRLARRGVRVLVQCPAEQPELATAALAAGAAGVVITGSPVDRPQPTPADLEMSLREREVLTLVAAGHSNSEVAQVLELSPLTVKTHLARIARKLSTGDRAVMALVALRHGLIV